MRRGRGWRSARDPTGVRRSETLVELRCGVPLEHERAERVGPRDRTERYPVADDRAELGGRDGVDRFALADRASVLADVVARGHKARLAVRAERPREPCAQSYVRLDASASV